MEFSMKRQLSFIIALIAVIGFAVVSCDNGNKTCSHIFGDWNVETAATCVAAGTGTKTCTICGTPGSDTVIPIDPNAHDLIIVSITTFCTEDGDTTWKCDRDGCEYNFIETDRPELGHNWDFPNYDITLEPTCLTKGSKTRSCTRENCDEIDVQEIPIDENAHDWVYDSNAMLPTCTTQGEGQKNCTLCLTSEPGGTYPVNPNAHVFNGNKWIETTAPTCTISATDTEKCDYDSCNALNAGNTRIGRSALNHDSSGAAATCITSQVCARSDCEHIIQNALGHQINTWTLVTTPALTGEETGNCERCGLVTRPAPATEGLVFTAIGTTAFSVGRGTATDTIIIIPAEHNGRPVTTIVVSGFLNYAAMTDIFIPARVTTIGNSAFSGCAGLTSVTIPDSVTSIGQQAFQNCTGLTSISIPNSVTSIGLSTFQGCTSLTSIIIPNRVTIINSGLFSGCTNLTSVAIPNSVTRIEGNAFLDCTSLTNITIPNNVTIIVTSAFRGCTGLTNITIPSSVISIGDNAFNGCTGLTSLTISNGVRSIGNGTFQNCTGLTSIIIPDSVTTIGDRTFSGCTGLTSITIPNSVTSIGQRAFQNCTSLTSITIPNSVTSISTGTFGVCSALTNINIPNSVTSIGQQAFEHCTSLTSITIPSSVTSINPNAFDFCTSLTRVTIERTAAMGITTLGTLVFNGTHTTLRIVVPAGSVAAYKAATNWNAATIVNRIHANGCTNTSNPCGVNCQ